MIVGGALTVDDVVRFLVGGYVGGLLLAVICGALVDIRKKAVL